MKKFTVFLLNLSLLLASCNGSDSGSDDGSNGDTYRFVEYKASDFLIDKPEDWETVNSFTSEYPDGIRVAFRDNLKDGDFVANVTVIREANEDNLTSFDVLQEKLSEHEDHLLDYTLLTQEELTLSVGGGESKTTLFTFSGKNESSSEPLQFMQLALAKGEQAYIVTATYDPREDEFTVERMLTMLKSFELR
ncbi:hypothetical protein IPG41_01235 [Candidatus Peregrinibacteria bacterium]|nr:MAG: hypothetical protein IPG41_01235 [Candidatus Peregrinibacteria bacterium]